MWSFSVPSRADGAVGTKERDVTEKEAAMLPEANADWLPRPLSAVVCDMDGLLIDSEAAHWTTMKEAAVDLGFPFPHALFLRMVGVDRIHNRALLREELGPEFPLDVFYEDSDRRFEALIREAVPLRPGVFALFDALDRLGLKRAVATSTMSPWAEERLQLAGLLERVDAVVTFSDVARPKPAPDPYLLAIERLGVPASEAIAVEDSHNGVRAASAAMLTTVMVPDLLGPTEETDRLVAATLPSLGTLAEILVREFG
jgi:HAD superfamily hydrolase (TIGR01509 family)